MHDSVTSAHDVLQAHHIEYIAFHPFGAGSDISRKIKGNAVAMTHGPDGMSCPDQFFKQIRTEKTGGPGKQDHVGVIWR